MNYYELKAIYNPFDEDFMVNVSSPVTNTGEEYVIESKGILVLPEIVALSVVTQVSREVLRKKGKEFDDLSRPKIEEDLLSHEFEIRDLSKPIVEGEKPARARKGGK